MGDQELAAQAGLPWPPGDAAGLRAAATMLTSAAEPLDAAGGLLWPIDAAAATWTGRSGPVFDAAVAAEVSALGTASTGLTTAADAVTALADVVEAAQETVGTWAQRVIDAETAATGAVGTATPSDDPGGVRATALTEAGDAVDDVALADAAAADAVGGIAVPLGGTGAMPSPPATPLAMAVAEAYAPVYRFDKDEDHYPGDVEGWIANADLKQRDDGTWYFDPRGEEIRDGDLDDATLPVAYHVTDDGELQLEYGLFYPFNDFPDMPNVPFAPPVDHEGDFEPFTVQFGSDGQPEAADFESHGHTRVRPWEDVEVTADGRPVVYPSHGGHGNNPEPGRYDNDKPGWVPDSYRDDADGEGVEWDPAPVLVDANAIPELRGDDAFADVDFGEDVDQGRGNPKSFLHEDQGPPPDLDGDDDDPAAEPGGEYPAPAA